MAVPTSSNDGNMVTDILNKPFSEVWPILLGLGVVIYVLYKFLVNSGGDKINQNQGGSGNTQKVSKDTKIGYDNKEFNGDTTYVKKSRVGIIAGSNGSVNVKGDLKVQ